MPIPKPTPQEDKKSFISRCMGDSVMNKEYPDSKQRARICYSQWDRKSKGEVEDMKEAVAELFKKEKKS